MNPMIEASALATERPSSNCERSCATNTTKKSFLKAILPLPPYTEAGRIATAQKVPV